MTEVFVEQPLALPGSAKFGFCIGMLAPDKNIFMGFVPVQKYSTVLKRQPCFNVQDEKIRSSGNCAPKLVDTSTFIGQS